MPENEQVQQSFADNDEWLAAASEYYSDILTRYVLGAPLAVAEHRLVDILRMRIGVMPESAIKYKARLKAQAERPVTPVPSQWD